MDYLNISNEEKAALIRKTSVFNGMPPIIIEKDYWVVQILNVMFNNKDNCDNLIFKGGTSLSKCHNIINRFSEDLDITFKKRSSEKLYN